MSSFKVKWSQVAMLAPLILRFAGHLTLLGGSIATVSGYPEMGAALLAIASVLGIRNDVNNSHTN